MPIYELITIFNDFSLSNTWLFSWVSQYGCSLKSILEVFARFMDNQEVKAAVDFFWDWNCKLSLSPRFFNRLTLKMFHLKVFLEFHSIVFTKHFSSISITSRSILNQLFSFSDFAISFAFTLTISLIKQSTVVKWKKFFFIK